MATDRAVVEAPGGPGLLERDAELALLERLVDTAAASTGNLVLIEGPAGIGKSALLAELRRRAAAAGCGILAARGSELEREFAFGVVGQLFEGAVAAAPPAERDRLLGGAAARAARLFPVLDEPGSPVGHSSFALQHALYWLTVNLAGGRPLLLVVDDAHWADPASLAFLGFLARRLETLPVLLVVTTRPAEPGVTPGVLEDLDLEPGSFVVEPEPLSPPAVATLVRAALGEAAHEVLCAACHEASGGNPFYLGELLRELRGADAPSVDQVRTLGPRRVATAVLVRIGRLDPPAGALACTLAVLDRAELRLAAELADLDLPEAGTAADALFQAGVLSDERPELSFVHPVVRQAIYRDLPPTERAAAHGRAARLLAAAGAGPEAVAAHLLAGEPQADPWAVARLREAAQEALAWGVPDAAVRYLQRAMAEPPESADRPELLIELGAAANVAGGPDPTGSLTEAWELATDPELRARVAFELGFVLADNHRVVEAVAILEQGGEELRGSGSQLAVELRCSLLLMGMLTAATRRRTRARFRATRAQMAESAAEATALLGPLAAFDLLVSGGTADEVAALVDRAVRTTPGRVDRAFWILPGLSTWLLVETGRLEAAERCASQAIATMRAHGALHGLALAAAMRALVRHRRGALAAAEADATTGLEIAAELGVWHGFSPATLNVLVSVLLDRGEPAAARIALGRAEGQPCQPDGLLDQLLYEANARVLMAEGNPRAALVELAVCRDFEAAYGIDNGVVPVAWRGQAALAHLALGELDQAHRLAAEEVRLARRFGAPRPLGLALHALGLVLLAASDPSGREHLREAAGILERAGLVLDHARVQAGLGAALRRANQRVEARRGLRAALETARSCGARDLAEAAAVELQAAGGPSMAPRQRGAHALTVSERRVAQLAAEGLTNAAIAQALFVSVKTVEMHLSSTYRKLAISSRSQLPAVLAGQNPSSDASGRPEALGDANQRESSSQPARSHR